MGPGTHINQRIERGDIPLSRHDALALIHDLDYLASYSIEDLMKADVAAISKSSFDLQGLSMIAGLTTRTVYSLDMAGKDRDRAQELLNKARSNLGIRRVFELHQIPMELNVT